MAENLKCLKCHHRPAETGLSSMSFNKTTKFSKAVSTFSLLKHPQMIFHLLLLLSLSLIRNYYTASHLHPSNSTFHKSRSQEQVFLPIEVRCQVSSWTAFEQSLRVLLAKRWISMHCIRLGFIYSN